MTDGLENKRILSNEAENDQESRSVFDFLYYDVQRVGSFYAQLTGIDDWQQLSESNTVSKGTKRGWKVGVGGGMSELAKGEASFERGPEEGGSAASERVYDPLWLKAVDILGFLKDEDMIHRDIRRAQMGQFVLVSGQLSVADLALLQGMWKINEVKSSILNGMLNEIPQAQNRNEREKLKREADKNLDVFLRIVELLPHPLQARLTDSENRMIWTALQREHLIGSASDLFLKHGIGVAGKWSILGILDALPDTSPDGNLTEAEKVNAARVAASFADSPFGLVLVGLAPLVRQLGRPRRAFGMTPLLIFREVSPQVTLVYNSPSVASRSGGTIAVRRGPRELTSADLTSLADAPGIADQRRAAAPATKGAAKLVPLSASTLSFSVRL